MKISSFRPSSILRGVENVAVVAAAAAVVIPAYGIVAAADLGERTGKALRKEMRAQSLKRATKRIARDHALLSAMSLSERKQLDRDIKVVQANARKATAKAAAKAKRKS